MNEPTRAPHDASRLRGPLPTLQRGSMTTPADLAHLTRQTEPVDTITPALIKAVAALDAIASLIEAVINEREGNQK